MDVLIWSQEDFKLFGLCLKRGQAYMGPYATSVIKINGTTLLLAANCWLYLLEPEANRLLKSRNIKSSIDKVVHGKRMILTAGSQQLTLLNESLDIVRIFDIRCQNIHSIFCSTRGFLVVHSGQKINSQPLVRFLNVESTKSTCYHKNKCLSYEKPNLVVRQMETGQLTRIKLPQYIELFETMQCRQVGTVVLLTINLNIHLCFNQQLKNFLYQVDDKRLKKQAGSYFLEPRHKQYGVLFLDESSIEVIGTIPEQEDDIEAIIPLGKNYYIVKQLLLDNMQQRRIEKVEVNRNPQSPPDSPFSKKLPTGLFRKLPIEPIETIEEEATENHQMLLNKNGSLPNWSEPFMSPQDIPCSPIVQIVENTKNFNTAKDLFLNQNSFQSQQSVSSDKQQEALNETSKFPKEKVDSTPSFKLSFGLMDSTLFNKRPQTVQQFILSHKTPKNVPIEDVIQFIKDNCNMQQSQLDNQTKRLKLFDTIDVDKYLHATSKPITQLISTYVPAQERESTTELMFQQILKEQSDIVDQVVGTLPPEEQLQKMQRLLGRLQSENQRKKFKRECYKYLSDRQLRCIPSELLLDPLAVKDQKLLFIFHPEVKLVELSCPLELLSTILQLYFTEDGQNELESDCVEIEGEMIEITNPRNMLNIILYFAQLFQCSSEDAIGKYIKVLLSRHSIELISHIVYTEGVLEICGLSNTLLEDIVRMYERELYFKDGSSLEGFEECLELVVQNVEYKKKAMCRLNIINSLDSDVLVSYSDVYLIENRKNGIMFLRGLIEQEKPSTIIGIGLEGLYQNVWMLEQQQIQNRKLTFYTRQLLTLTQFLICRCLASQCFEQAIVCMKRIQHRLRKGLIAYAILRFLKCHQQNVDDYIPKLKTYNRPNLLTLFEQLIENIHDVNEPSEEQDNQRQCNFVCCTVQSVTTRLKRHKTQIVNKYSVLSEEQFCELLYYRTKMALHIAQFDDGINTQNLDKFLLKMQKQGLYRAIIEKTHNPKEICGQLPIVFSIPILEKWSPGEPQSAQPRKEEVVKRTNSVDSLELRSVSLKVKTEIVPKQRRNRSYMRLEEYDYRRLDSSPQIDLERIKELKDETSQIEFLKTFFETNSAKGTLHLTKHIKTSIKLYRLEKLAEIEDYDLEYDFHNIFTFAFLCQESDEDAFRLIQDRLKTEVNSHNFWLIAHLVQHVLGAPFARQLAIIFCLKKLTHSHTSEADLNQEVLIICTHFGLPIGQINKLAQVANDHGFYTLADRLAIMVSEQPARLELVNS